MTTYRSLITLEKIFYSGKWYEVVLITSGTLKKKLAWAIKEIKELSLPNLRIITVPDGEKAKEWEPLRKLLVKFTKCRLNERSLVVALGGGSISDLVGFACSVYGRGSISYINIPTTLLAQVDASIGGKTAINFEGYKNLIGSFHKPIAVFLIAKFFGSLSEGHFVDGLAEITKAGTIRDPEILNILDSCTIAGLRNDPFLLDELIQRATAVKEHFVGKDYKDNGSRKILNLGHTIGHALELKYGLSHGMSVLHGMMQELEAVEHLGVKTIGVRDRLARTLENLGINLDVWRFTVDLGSPIFDKKVSGEKIILPVVEEVGKARLIKVGLKELMAAIRKCNQKRR